MTVLHPKFSQPGTQTPPPPRDPGRPSRIPTGVLEGVGLVIIGLVVVFVLPEAGVLVASGLILVIVVGGVLLAWRRRRQLPPRESPRRRIRR